MINTEMLNRVTWHKQVNAQSKGKTFLQFPPTFSSFRDAPTTSAYELPSVKAKSLACNNQPQHQLNWLHDKTNCTRNSIQSAQFIQTSRMYLLIIIGWQERFDEDLLYWQSSHNDHHIGEEVVLISDTQHLGKGRCNWILCHAASKVSKTIKCLGYNKIKSPNIDNKQYAWS